MPNILIVEDSAEKLADIAQLITSKEHLDIGNITECRTLNSAKKLLREENYDILLLDLCIPDTAEKHPRAEAGIELLNEIYTRRHVYNIPTHILGITANPDALDLSTPYFKDNVIHIIEYDKSTDQWKKQLAKYLDRVSILDNTASNSNEPLTHMCIITALHKPELEAVLNIDWSWETLSLPNDPTTYHEGTLIKNGQEFRIIAAAASQMGMASAASLATKMIMSFKPKHLAMTGILAGIEGETDFGDIIAIQTSWNYEAGKRTIVNGEKVFKPDPHQISIDSFTLKHLREIASDDEALNKIRANYSSSINRLLRMHIGQVGCGSSVLEDTTIVEKIAKDHNRKLLGIEMETYGVYLAAQEAPLPRPNFLSIKSVCDFANTDKDNKHQEYASYTSAKILELFAMKHL